MTKSIQSLLDDNALLQQLLLKQQALLESKDSEIAELNQSYQTLLEQFRLAQHHRFGRSSEVCEAQGELFNEAETLVEDDILEADTTPERETTPPKTKEKPKRKPLPKHLPRVQVIHDIDEADKQCDCCGHQLQQMGKDVSEKLEFIPAKVKVIENIRLKYSCQHCEKSGTQPNIKQASVPSSPIPKGYATPSLLSQIITSKYQYALPLYRQETMFKQHGIEISRRTMSDWMMKCGALFKPLHQRLREIQLSQPVIQADETTVKVINDERAKSYIWVYCSGADSPASSNMAFKGVSIMRNIVLFDYQNGSRSGACPLMFLGDFNGYLQTDGYAAYQKVNAELVGCWAHARRKFIEAQTAQGKTKVGKVNVAISFIQKLYAIEKNIADLSVDEKMKKRQIKSEPILADFKAWLDKSALQVSSKGKLGEAITYSLNQWSKLKRYTESGLLNIDNNRAERAVKPFVIGRKNWLFNINHKGAETSAMLYSIIETAKANGLIPFDYINHCLEELAKSPIELESLLPWNVKLG
ncbi:IS66 family transposase [Parashewanella spongiae]|uniref:IS66 family transposase n=1 Tax=Parashewanella spongiae TaxID=342950 RepID=UPI00105A315B|nr:IS66 family transposase [Parashewanella spongiae]